MSENEPVPVDSASVGIAKTVRKRRKNESDAWEHFELLPDGYVLNVNDDYKRSKCKHCGHILITDSRYGTSNMSRHVKKCPALTNKDIGQMLLTASTTTGSLVARTARLNQEEFREVLAKAIVQHEHPFLFVEQPGIRNCLSYLNPEVKHVTRNTTRADVLKLFRNEKQRIYSILQTIPGRICLTMDLWSSLCWDGYLCITAHFVDSYWKLKSVLLNFVHFPPPHSGINICEKVSSLLNEWDIEDRLFTITLDNASNNDTFMDVYTKQLEMKNALVCKGKYFHIRCCCHVLNIIVQEGLKDIEQSVTRVRESVKYFRGSAGRIKKFNEVVKQLNIPSKKKLVQDVVTRWNATYEMLDTAIIYQRAFVHLGLSDNNYKDCPTFEEWDKIEKICKFLKLFYDLTKTFSGIKYPTSNLFFHGVWQIQHLLKEEANSTDDFTKNMAAKMQTKFDKYWGDCNLILCMAVVLDPRYKMKCVEFAFSKIYGGQSHVKVLEIRSHLYDLFKFYSTSSTSNQDITSNSGVLNPSSHTEESNDDPYNFGYDSFRSQDDSIQVMKSELDHYLEEPAMNRKKEIDILEFWNSVKYRFPQLSSMARDILSIPISSVASEQVFSVGGRVLRPARSCLSHESVEALICTRDWLFGLKEKVHGDIDDLSDKLMDLSTSESFHSNEVIVD